MELLAANPLGTVPPPQGVVYFAGGQVGGITIFITIIVRLIIVGAGVYGLINLALAGYSFMSAGGDSKQVADAWAKIWQTMLGIGIAAGSLVLAALIGILFFRDATALINPAIYTPN
jgi:hypothetical protein